MDDAHRQGEYDIRFDWGASGADAVGRGVAVTVLVDVLSFTTALSVAADRGIEVFPYRWGRDDVAEFAAERGAAVAVGRRVAGPGRVSLSPGTIRRAPGLTRLVLPSPNGSALAHRLAGTGAVCVGASLRNAAAVARWIVATHGAAARVAVVAAGERWPDGSLRPCVEDLWGAGAVLANLPGPHRFSPEALVAVQAWRAVEADVGAALRACASGRELVDGGFPDDVAVAAESGCGTAVPVLTGDRFTTPGRG